ncbi:MAG: UvrD-helicase domain-containing protein, partial [Gemmatimonadetes bacterium]|nr:UvrD-helicase domain-containing protein [Gemmatimonadota bacterium]
MNVGTLDSFFVRVAKSFSQELGLAPGWTIADNLLEKRLLTDAVQIALSKLETSELAELLRALNMDHSKRSVHDDLLRKIDDFVFIQRHLDPNLTDHWQPEFGEPVQSANIDVQREANDLAGRLEALPIPKNDSRPYAPNGYWVKAINSAVPAIAGRDWPSVLGAGVGAQVMAKNPEFRNKTITSDFKDIFETARHLARVELSSKYRRRSKAMGRLAELLERVFEDVQHRMGAYRFNDIGYLLGGDDPTGGRDDLQYRLDQQVRHILLDEFQDTSLLQWRALRPLADELLSGHLGERAGVIVADPKQSIYAWRGARPGLARQVGRDYALNSKSMTKSWRSTPEIIDFVAEVFDEEKLPKNEILGEFSVGEKVASDWLEDFTQIEAAKHKHETGHVRIHLAPAEGQGSGRKAIRPNLLRRAAEIVKCLHKKMPTRSIGVLVRSNAVLSHIMDELQALNVPASGEGGTSLTDTPPVNAILSLLKLADHPLNTAACYHVATSPVSGVVGFKDYRDQPAARDLAIGVREELVTEGYGPTLARWVRGLVNHCDAREVRRLLQLVDLGYRWDDR